MTKAAAIHTFFSSFGISAYEASKVPADAAFPYLTYQYGETPFDTGDFVSTVNVYYLGNSNVAINSKVDQIRQYIGRGGRCINCDGGHIWLKCGSPWAQTVDEPNTDINRRMLNIDVEFMI